MSTIQICQGPEKQGKHEKQSQIWRHDDEMHDDICARIGPGLEKGH